MQTARLTTSESLALDVIRVVAAALVAFGHLTQFRFSTGWPDLTYVARCAVSVFFILSGFVIRYVTCRKPATFKHYLGDRASRIYSITLPAFLFALIADTISRHVNPGFYAAAVGVFAHPLSAIAVNLIFCGQLWTHTIQPLSNGPFWSVNYEVAYYILYGCWFYLTGIKRWFWIIAISAFFGPHVLYLAPLWIVGCILHDLYQRWNAPGVSAAGPAWLTFATLAALAAFCLKVLAIQRSGQSVSSTPMLRIAFIAGVRPPDYLFGLVWAVIFLALLFFARQFVIKPDSPLVGALHFISEGTFPIYLLHFPLFVLIAACIPYNHANPLPKLIIFFFTLVIGILAGHPGNILKAKLRSLNFFSAPQTTASPQRTES